MVKQSKFIIEIDKLKQQDISVLKAVKREGEKHLEYYYSTMNVFKNAQNRVKTFDTVYYEEVIPIINDILSKL